ncbi:MAG: ABC transporter ATP-binding protein [Ferrimonas sp.]
MAVLAINQLHYQWSLDHHLQVPELTIKAGEKVMLQGASGSGKTTVMNLIAGVLNPQQGKVQLQGTELQSLNGRQRDRHRAEHLGIIFQQFNLLPFLSVLDNVLLPLTFAEQRRIQISQPQEAAMALLDSLELPNEYYQKPVHQLSVGQQQRVAAARALLGSPALILADEPTSALDPDNRDRFMALLQQQCEQQGSALLLISHDPALRPLMDKCYQLRATERGSEVISCGV